MRQTVTASHGHGDGACQAHDGNVVKRDAAGASVPWGRYDGVDGEHSCMANHLQHSEYKRDGHQSTFVWQRGTNHKLHWGYVSIALKDLLRITHLFGY